VTFSLKIRTAVDLQAEQLLVMKAAYERAVKAHLDAVAQLRKYDDARSIIGYWNSTREDWRQEARAFGAWQDEVWTFMIELLEAIEAGREVAPNSVEDLIAMLPALPWLHI
jgi:RecB family exonuclease